MIIIFTHSCHHSLLGLNCIHMLYLLIRNHHLKKSLKRVLKTAQMIEFNVDKHVNKHTFKCFLMFIYFFGAKLDFNQVSMNKRKYF